MREGPGRARHTLTRRGFLAAAAGIVSAARLLAPRGASAQAKGTLRIARGANARSLDPHINARLYDRVVLYTLYEPLIDADSQGNFFPVLARSWEIGSTGRVVTFHLRPGVVFHDGTPFTAEVVKYNIERILDPATGSEHRVRFEGIIQGVRAVDSTTAQLYLTRPYPPLFSELMDRPGLMVSPAAVKKYGKDFARNPVGTGPFKFVEWIQGNRVVVQRYPQYWNAQAIRSESMIFLEFPEPAVADAQLRGGQVDVVTLEGLPAEDILAFQKDTAYRVIPSPAYAWAAIEMKVDVPPFDNRDLRQAIMYAIDREQIVKVIYHGLGKATGKFFHEGWWADPSYNGPKYRPEMARQKLKASGYLDKPTPLLLYVLNSTVPLGEMIQAQMQAIGLEINIRLVSERDQYPMVLRGEIPFSVPSTWTPRPDPHGLAYILWDSKGYADSSHYSNPQVDKLLEDASATYDRKVRTKLYRQAERLIVDDASYVFYYASPDYAITRRDVQGFRYGFDLIPRVAGAWV
ncbi:MAG TPA: ABC transporter substrate-binding protein [bacterium]|nr:ABC transporter substrate-binding protein [bacterium]